MATTAFSVPQFTSTTLSTAGGIDDTQTTGIKFQSVSGLDITKPGIACLSYSNPIDTSKAEWITYTSIDGTNELQGVTRGAEGFSAKAHSNGVTVAFPLSKSHINNLNTALMIGASATNMVEGVIDDDTMATASATTIPTSESTKEYVDLRNNAPEGFLINGKIVPSVASSDLTVAIKGMDGNDPSASNPVYCRIGDTVRTLTAALSVTKADATNWFNAGSAELAAKEVDYFVYLGYNATDGVVIGFARIPHATEYDDFSATTTNEKYCAISTISNAAAGDDYELVGRFAATLSAGAGYTWTVPTFTNKNLIQRPIYETRWLTYLPTYSATGSMTWGTITGITNKYKICMDKINLIIGAIGTTGGTASNGLVFSTPFTMGEPQFYSRGGCSVKDTTSASPSIAGFIYNPTTASYAFQKYDGSNYGLGSGREANGNIIYSI